MSPVMMEIIEWFDETGAEIAHRYPERGSGDIKLGAQLVVRENQAALFFRDGQALDVFGPGRHTLSTQNLPILTRLLSLPWGFTSPFRAEVYFVSLKVFTSMRWGTRDPVAFRDSQLGLIRLRAFGTFTLRVTQPSLFVNSLVGTSGSYSTDQLEDYLREVIVARLNDFLGDTVDTLIELPSQYDEMAVAVKTRVAEDFRKYGMELVDFFINRITPPEEVQRMIDERSSMGAVGNLDHFLKFKAAKAMGDVATGGGVGGGAAAGVGVGVGAGLGMMLPGMLGRNPGGEPAGPASTPATIACPGCQAVVARDSRFCPRCGRQLAVTRRCTRCQADLPTDARFCASCGQAVSTA
jgi:membrane protease subunit (stomatin/prohibitin family)